MSTQSNSGDQQRQSREVAGTKPAASDPHRDRPADAAESTRGKPNPNPEALDEVDEAIDESFPASDPPSYTGGSATPSAPKKKD